MAAVIDTEQYRVQPGTRLHLPDWPTKTTNGFDGGKADAKACLEELNLRLTDLQQLLYAEGKHKMLVVLQGMDTSGKDGTIKHVFKTINPLGVKVANFKKPNEVELAHDFLWRVHTHAPRNGRIAIFNRSHYEDVLIVRVHDMVPDDVWRPRFEHIRNFEQMLVDEGTVVVKFFLHISRSEQKERLEERLENPAKQWKFEHGDISERAHWDDYTTAYEDAITTSATVGAPWYIVPSDRKWYRNLVVSQVLINALEDLDMSYPDPIDGIENIRIED
ncbi:polyphosphate kinase 2 family protein [Rhabdothermincola salaria]|uniref:polyphosphate kinase 2 family protein n=1 Tax=Rhabdothermincola salaria TaxID=2903142 RepID=UPI001E305B3C|nr:polyphosphate kinase 2 family protein [Rhabdothermincola salaria]MCD9625043.1 polyphosphate kinase 2 family protein [Rhabdothermincola salaria]